MFRFTPNALKWDFLNDFQTQWLKPVKRIPRAQVSYNQLFSQILIVWTHFKQGEENQNILMPKFKFENQDILAGKFKLYQEIVLIKDLWNLDWGLSFLFFSIFVFWNSPSESDEHAAGLQVRQPRRCLRLLGEPQWQMLGDTVLLLLYYRLYYLCSAESKKEIQVGSHTNLKRSEGGPKGRPSEAS